jgi:hypothetical protein
MSNEAEKPTPPQTSIQRELRRIFDGKNVKVPQVNDGGPFRIGTKTENGHVVVGFPKPIVWFAMTPQEAVQFAQTLMKHAAEAGNAVSGPTAATPEEPKNEPEPPTEATP